MKLPSFCRCNTVNDKLRKNLVMWYKLTLAVCPKRDDLVWKHPTNQSDVQSVVTCAMIFPRLTLGANVCCSSVLCSAIYSCIHYYTLLVFNLTLYCTILQALALLERIIWADPTTNLQEGLLFNLCTIYELESSYSLQKKQKLLEFVSKHRGDGFNISCLKIP